MSHLLFTSHICLNSTSSPSSFVPTSNIENPLACCSSRRKTNFPFGIRAHPAKVATKEGARPGGIENRRGKLPRSKIARRYDRPDGRARINSDPHAVAHLFSPVSGRDASRGTIPRACPCRVRELAVIFVPLTVRPPTWTTSRTIDRVIVSASSRRSAICA